MYRNSKNVTSIIVALILIFAVIFISTSIMFAIGIYGMYDSVKKVHECGVENPVQLDNGRCPNKDK